ncbi:MAG: hypothetical protein JOZ47_12680 [Kutzneria sp.]|nr:hypothetical protein [Kutzneria sp.]MBV9845913.1 hypothetical protein [Kutzneria sp.]
MRRVNLRGVPDDVYEALARSAEVSRQSMNAFVMERLAELTQVLSVADYLMSYTPPAGTGITLNDAAAAVRDIREAS